MPTIRIESEHPTMIETGMEFFLTESAPGRCTATAHIHDAIEIICVREGDFFMTVGESHVTARAGEIVLFRSGVLHSIYAGSASRSSYDVLKLRPSLLFDLAAEQRAAGYVLRLVISPPNAKLVWTESEAQEAGAAAALALLRRRAEDQNAPCRDIAMKLAGAELVHALLASLIAQEGVGESVIYESGATAPIYQAVRRLHRQYAEPLTARQCAADVNLSYSYFSRNWQKIVGRPFKEYLGEIRLRHAERLLKSTNMPVTQVALECGYGNVSYFIACYRASRGITPSAVRRGG